MARRFSIRKRQGINIPRVVSKVAGTIIALYAGGYVITTLGDVMNGSCSPFYKGLKLIGWSVGTHLCTDTSASNANTIYSTSGSGVLAVVGIIGVASIVLEFVEFRLG